MGALTHAGYLTLAWNKFVMTYLLNLRFFTFDFQPTTDPLTPPLAGLLDPWTIVYLPPLPACACCGVGTLSCLIYC